MIKAKELIARLEMMVESYGEDCTIDTFSDVLDVYNQHGECVQEIDI